LFGLFFNFEKRPELDTYDCPEWRNIQRYQLFCSEKKGTVLIHSHLEPLNFWIKPVQVCLDWQPLESLSKRVSGIVMSAAAYRAVCTPADVEKV
jgi:hypothetical protein